MYTFSSEDPHVEVQEILAKHSSDPESEPRLKLLLPHIVSTFGGNKSVKEIMEELEKNQRSDDPTGMITLLKYSIFERTHTLKFRSGIREVMIHCVY